MNENSRSEIHEHLAKLRTEHRTLDDQISDLESNRAQFELEIRRLKKRKLTLKDEIGKIENGFLPDIIA